jgi:molybdopterin synthase catalytic subunit
LNESETQPIVPERVLDSVRTDASGCVIGFISRQRKGGPGQTGGASQEEIAATINDSTDLQGVSFIERQGKIAPGEVREVIAVSAGHRKKAFVVARKLAEGYLSRSVR